MSDEYIPREAALTEFAKVCDVCMALMPRPTCGECSIADTVRKIKHIPAADVAEVRHGHWIKHYRQDCAEVVIVSEWGSVRDEVFCSVCSAYLGGSAEYEVKGNYCPNCGAKMDKSEDAE